jgi:hypothetical protein
MTGKIAAAMFKPLLNKATIGKPLGQLTGKIAERILLNKLSKCS